MKAIDVIGMQTELEIIQNSTENALDLLKISTTNIIPMHRHKAFLIAAAKEIGVKEVPGAGNNKRVQEYYSWARKDNDLSKTYPDSVAWCAAFIAFCLETSKAPMSSTNALNARSYSDWGRSTLGHPAPGDIVVFWRVSRNDWRGHVGIYIKENSNGDILTLGGNQSDEVNLSWQSGQRVLDIRRSRLAPSYTSDTVHDLQNITEDIIQGRNILVGGSVA